MANCVLVPSKITAMDVDAYNEKGVYTTADVNNGAPLTIGVTSTTDGQGEVFTVTPVASDTATGVWLAYSPEVVTTASGTLNFKGIDVDPRDFTNIKGVPFDMFKPNAGVDMIQVTEDFFATSKSPTTVTGATVVELNASGAFEAKTTSTSGYTGIGFKIVKSAPITIASGALGGEQVNAWVLMCTQN